jgi:hypothetical protein
MNQELLKEFQLQAGGSHYPLINPNMQEAFARLIVKECIRAVDSADLRTIVKTTFDNSQAEGVKGFVKQAIAKRFELDPK